MKNNAHCTPLRPSELHNGRITNIRRNTYIQWLFQCRFKVLIIKTGTPFLKQILNKPIKTRKEIFFLMCNKSIWNFFCSYSVTFGQDDYAGSRQYFYCFIYSQRAFHHLTTFQVSYGVVENFFQMAMKLKNQDDDTNFWFTPSWKVLLHYKSCDTSQQTNP